MSAHGIDIPNVLNYSDDLSKKKAVKETFNQVKRHTGLPLQEPKENVNKNTCHSPIEYLSKGKKIVKLNV